MKKLTGPATGAALLAMALSLGACGGGDGNSASGVNMQAPLPQIAAPNNGDWTQTVGKTPEGGTRLGNPNAPVKLVEYGSLTCPACRAFSQAGTQRLRDTYVRSGQVSWEFRPLIIHGAADVALSLLTNCQPPAAYFRTIEQIYEQQPRILEGFTAEEQSRIQSLPPEQMVLPVAQALDLNVFFAQRGIPASRFNQCLSDQAAVQRLADITNRAMTIEGVPGTPTFFINGELLTVSSWSDLEPLLRQRVGG